MPEINEANATRAEILGITPTGGKNRGRKNPSPVTVDRVEQIAALITKGKSRDYCLKYIEENFGTHNKCHKADLYNKAVKLLTPKDWEEEKQRIVAKNIAVLENIVEKCTDKEDYKNALDAIKTLHTLFGIGGKTVGVKTAEEEIIIHFD